MYLTSDAVIAATKDTMEDTIHYIDDKYGGAASYLHEVQLHPPCAPNLISVPSWVSPYKSVYLAWEGSFIL